VVSYADKIIVNEEGVVVKDRYLVFVTWRLPRRAGRPSVALAPNSSPSGSDATCGLKAVLERWDGPALGLGAE
jgi:hypothetical protein